MEIHPIRDACVCVIVTPLGRSASPFRVVLDAERPLSIFSSHTTECFLHGQKLWDGSLRSKSSRYDSLTLGPISPSW
jgi:hypothetical protein